MLKVMTIVGTRPEIIRLSRIIEKFDRHFEHVLVHTGQNYDYELNQVFFEDLGVRAPDRFLEAAGSNPAETIGKVIIAADAASQLAEKMRHLARTDVVTGLTNRAGLNQDAVEMLMALPADHKLAMFWLDLDRFKEVNDVLGHPVGDRVLSEVASRLRAAAPAGRRNERRGASPRWNPDQFRGAGETTFLQRRLCRRPRDHDP